ncbi:MAG TPA: tol-pal system-associated acyl-CoA thioesterase [Gammaproteobacteria bacterium]|nr:tol-pal system-associated acyl-CoA thioesterase [Gammaproteobacteria bacterium]
MHEFTLRVFYEDTDATGVVYHANYVKYMERCRSDWLEKIGWNVLRVNEQFAIAFAVSNLSVQYLQPARLNDVLSVKAELTRLGAASLSFAQEVWRESNLVCRGELKVACLDEQSFKPVQIPRPLYDAIAASAVMPK